MKDNVIKILENAIVKHEEVGASFIVTKGKEEIFSHSAGMADIERNVQMNADTICRAFSCSKIMTAVASMILMERGLLDINWNLEWIIPEFKEPYYIRDGKRIPSDRSIKIRDLLNMTSGIPYPGDGNEGINMTNESWYKLDESIKSNNSLNTVEFARDLGKNALMFNAGKEWLYGGSADVMGAVIEIISGERLSEFITRNILIPLRMNDTAFYVPCEKKDRLSKLYEYAGELPKVFSGSNLGVYDTFSPPKFESGGAGLFTTASDYSKLGMMLSCDGVFGDTRILNRKAVEFMRANALTESQKVHYNWDSLIGYGYGNFVRTLENKNMAGTFASEGSFGWDGWTGTYLLCDPAENMSFTLFIQRAGAGTTQLARNLVNAAYSLAD